MSTAKVVGGGREEMRALAAKLRAADPAMTRDLRRRFKNIAGPVVRRVQESAMEMPSHHAGHLRADIAKTVTSSVGFTKTGVRLDIVSYGRRMPAGQGEDVLPAHTDSARGWGHPVWARGPRSRWRWVHQNSGRPQWFEEPIARAGTDAQRAAQLAMDDTKRMLEH